jgi:hypothetical protein
MSASRIRHTKGHIPLSFAPHVVVPGQPPIVNVGRPHDDAYRYIGSISTLGGMAGTGTITVVPLDATQSVPIVLTAAHVIYDALTRKPVTQATFIPASCPGSAPGTGPSGPAAPFGIFAVTQDDIWFPPQYLDALGTGSSGEIRYDYGVLLLRQLIAQPEPALGNPPVMSDIDVGELDVEICGYSSIADGNMAIGLGDMLIDVGNGLALYNASAGPGSSGGPVRQRNHLGRIVAVNSSGFGTLDVNAGVLTSADVIADIQAWVAGRLA